MILYFSGTGNSKYIAQRIARELGDQALNLLDRLRRNDTAPLSSEKPWVVVSPIYVECIAEPLYSWLKQTPLLGSRQIYFVLNGGHASTNACHEAKRLAAKKRMEFQGAVCVPMPPNYPLVSAIKIESENADTIRAAEHKILLAASQIAGGRELPMRQKCYPQLLVVLFRAVATLFYRFYVRPE